MQLAISNIAWDAKDDELVYSLMRKYGFTGLEIAPTRIFPENPYDHLEDARDWSENLDFDIPSMQSVWFGRDEKIFGTEEERQVLIDYMKKAIDFASIIKCKNLVFGCPRNRNKPDNADIDIAIKFFNEIGDYAAKKGTCIGMEANPPIYNTNFINDTTSAIKLIKQVNSEGFKLNLDIGTMIENDESVSVLDDNGRLINHVHISEPYLKLICKRKIHKALADYLFTNYYSKYVSIEMQNTHSFVDIEKTLIYIRNMFNA